MADDNQTELTKLTVELLSAYLANNAIPSSDLPALIASTRASLSDSGTEAVAPAEAFVPAVSVRKSLASKDAIISLIDGKPYKTLKRHLTTHGLTPAEYRSRYDLPANYPLVAPSYSERRREVAAANGLGHARKSASADKPAKTAAGPKTAVVKTPKPRTDELGIATPVPSNVAGEAKADIAPAVPEKAKSPRAPKSAVAKAPKARANKGEASAVKVDATPNNVASSAPAAATAADKPRRKPKIAVGGEGKPQAKGEPKAKAAVAKPAAEPKAPRAKKAVAPIAETAAPATAAARWDDKISV